MGNVLCRVNIVLLQFSSCTDFSACNIFLKIHFSWAFLFYQVLRPPLSPSCVSAGSSLSRPPFCQQGSFLWLFSAWNLFFFWIPHLTLLHLCLTVSSNYKEYSISSFIIIKVWGCYWCPEWFWEVTCILIFIPLAWPVGFLEYLGDVLFTLDALESDNCAHWPSLCLASGCPFQYKGPCL